MRSARRGWARHIGLAALAPALGWIFASCGPCPDCGPTPPPFSSEVESYDPVADTWTAETPMPAGRSHTECVAIGNAIYVAGGAVHSRAFFRYDALSLAWTVLPRIPTPRGDHAVAAIGTDVYVLGGMWTEKDVEVFDAQTHTWSTGPSMTEAHVGLEAVALGGRIYAMGGGTDVMEVFDSGLGAWQTAAPLPRVLRRFVADTDGSSVYVMGGSYYESATDTWESTRNVWLYDPASDQWTGGPPLPKTIFCAQAASIGQVIFVLDELSNLLSLDTTSGVWSARTPKNVQTECYGVAVAGGRIYTFGGHLR